MAEVTVAPAIPIGGGQYMLYSGPADYYCTGTDDQKIINSAIQYVSGAYGGGTVRLLEGTFNTSGKIIQSFSSTKVSGYSAVIVKNSDDVAWEIIGTAGAHLTDITVDGVSIERSSSDVYSHEMVSIQYADSITLRNILLVSAYKEGIFIADCLNFSVQGITVRDWNLGNAPSIYAIATGGTVTGSIAQCVVDGMLTSHATGAGALFGGIQAAGTINLSGNSVLRMRSNGRIIGIMVAGSGVSSANSIFDLSTSSITDLAFGIYNDGNKGSIIGNVVEQVQNSAGATGARGIRINSGSSTLVSTNYCYNNGADTGIANTNSNNFSDSGTDTQVYSNSWQSPVTGEPTWGEFHPHREVILTSATVTATTEVITATSTQIPLGTAKAVGVAYEIVAATSNLSMVVRDSAGNEWGRQRTQTANVPVDNYAVVPVTSTGGFKAAYSTTALSRAVTLTGYFS